jgi:putative peptidoglycan lipid II flippase
LPSTLVATTRRLLDRVFPRGAILLSVLSLAYFAMGIIRNRVFANTYGAGAELDAYNAAFRIPEVALDVLVAAGLTAPFVPIFTTLRRHDERGADDFGRTVLTAATVVMAVASAILFVIAPWLAERVGQGFDASTQALYVELLRINCLAQIMFAASICIGEVLVAHRQFLFYALAPILYTGGIILGTVLLSDTFGIVGSAIGAVVGATAHLGIRVVGTRYTTFRIGIGRAFRTSSFREFIRLMIPRMLSHPIEPLTFTYFTILASSMAVGSVSAVSFAADYQVVPVSLIGVSFSLAVFPVLSGAFADADRSTFHDVLRRNVLTIAVLTSLAAIALFAGAEILVSVLLGGGKFDAEDVATTTAVVRAFALSVPFDALAYPLSRGLYATHDTKRQVAASFAGFGVTLLASTLLVPVVDILAIPLGYAAGVMVKTALLVVFLVPRARAIGRTLAVPR